MAIARRGRSLGGGAVMGVQVRVMALVAVLLALGTPSPALSAAPASGSVCDNGWQPAPLASVETLADGGHIYHYDIDGDTAVPEPPSNFNPTVASDTTLARYGLPPRPADATDREAWNAEMGTWKPTPNRGLCITDRVFGWRRQAPETLSTFVPLNDVYWSGYAADESVDTYIAAQGDFVQKSFGSTSCSNAEMGGWLGIGGYHTLSLIQDGTAMYKVSGVAHYYAWYEYLDANHLNRAVEMPSVDVDAGESIHIYTVHQRSTGQTTFYIHNNTDGTEQSVIKTIASSYYDGTSAEHIAEPPGGRNLANFGNLNWTNTKVQLLAGNWVSLGSRTPDHITSWHYDSFGVKTNTANPDAMSSNTTFTDRWLNCHYDT